ADVLADFRDEGPSALLDRLAALKLQLQQGFESLRALGHHAAGDRLGKSAEILLACDEIGLAIDLDHASGQAIGRALDGDDALGRDTGRLLIRLREALLAHE